MTHQSYGKDKYGRTLADVLLPDGTNINHELVKHGWCWWYREYAPYNFKLAQLEAEAREAKRNLWSHKKPVPPWVYRHPELAKEEGLEPDTLAAGLENPPRPGKAIEGPIIGNKNSHKYHRPDCPSYTATAPKNRIIFENEEAAEKAGYELAGNCP